MKKLLLLLCGLLLLQGCAPVSPADSTPTFPLPSQSPTVRPTVPSDPSVPSSQPSDSTQQAAPSFSTDPTQLTVPVIELLASMTLEEKVGQLFLARCPEENALDDISTYHLGGFVLFGRDFRNETPDSITATIARYQSASKIPMLIAVDEEGGTVTRVSSYAPFRESRFPSSRELFERGGKALILSTEAEKCALLLRLGINVNLAPVCDITTDPAAFMYDRSLGQSPQVTADVICAMVDVMAQHGLGGVLKHFPGYGNNTDTHVAIAVDDRPLTQLESVDLMPFQLAIQAGCDAIMVSHVYINAIDPNLPATLSPAVHAYLRHTMGFDGVIVTDDLAMSAITDTYGAGEAAVLAILAGNDLLCVTDYVVQYEAILQAVKEGRICDEVLNAAVTRVLCWKAELGLILKE